LAKNVGDIMLRICQPNQSTCPAHLGLHGKNRNGPICVILPKVAKVRRRGWQILQQFCAFILQKLPKCIGGFNYEFL